MKSTASRLTTVALLVSLVGCATQGGVQPPIVPPREKEVVPVTLQTPPPPGDFQMRLRSFFLQKPDEPTK